MLTSSFHSLVAPWYQVPKLAITGLCLDSRKLKQGEVFIAIKGHQFDARTLIADAIAKGAAAIIAEADQQRFSLSYIADVPVLHFPNLTRHLSEISRRFYQKESVLPVIGVTGTNGKTTITQLIAQWLNLLNKPTAVMGTTGDGFLPHLTPSENTTGSALDIQKKLSDFSRQNAAYVAMEVSSHGLVQDRVRAVNFAAAIFSNLSRDHLDYHGSMQAYAEAKFSLFSDYDAPIVVINADDETGKAWLKKLPHAFAVSLTTPQAKGLWLTEVAYQAQGVKLSFDSSFGKGSFNAALVGEFNVMNLLLSLTTLLGLGYDLHTLLPKVPKLKAVIGRMEVFHHANKPMLVVDYAHTPDALEKALQALRIHCSGKLWCVFGCGGDRDKGKRPLMAKVAQRLADKVVLTNDNPRSEAPEQIMQEILAGMSVPNEVEVIFDRFEATRFAFERAQHQDVILLAGKGHEDYQILASGTLPYSDRETVQTLLEMS